MLLQGCDLQEKSAFFLLTLASSKVFFYTFNIFLLYLMPILFSELIDIGKSLTISLPISLSLRKYFTFTFFFLSFKQIFFTHFPGFANIRANNIKI